jgi:hypothetical protein
VNNWPPRHIDARIWDAGDVVPGAFARPKLRVWFDDVGNGAVLHEYSVLKRRLQH